MDILKFALAALLIIVGLYSIFFREKPNIKSKIKIGIIQFVLHSRGMLLIILSLILLFVLSMFTKTERNNQIYSIKGIIVDQSNKPIKGAYVYVLFNRSNKSEIKHTNSKGDYYFSKDTNAKFDASIIYGNKEQSDSETVSFNTEPYEEVKLKLTTALSVIKPKSIIKVTSNLNEMDYLIEAKLNKMVTSGIANHIKISFDYSPGNYHLKNGVAEYYSGGKVQMTVVGCKIFPVGNDVIPEIFKDQPSTVLDSLNASVLKIVKNNINNICLTIKKCL